MILSYHILGTEIQEKIILLLHLRDQVRGHVKSWLNQKMVKPDKSA